MSSSLHDHVVQSLGRAIVDGAIPQGTVMLAEVLEQKFGVSRSVIREAIRVLQSLGMTESVKRVGTRVLESGHWNALDPQLIRWRLASHEQGAQLRSLTELRVSVEPSAAALAARHAPADRTERLLQLSARMREAGTAGNQTLFADLDIEFHSEILRACGNDMFACLDSAIAEVIRGRTEHGFMPKHPSESTLDRHERVAHAIASGNSDEARSVMVEIMHRTMNELEPVWKDSPRSFG
ncbi:FadR/GntR family transcriptional regulator [Timonella senegalensis]|uniref:FadR/GntR family transcriptional regulator n=1 Tax=Timonella senegalensis TaxID=1465825 RepID=UPI0002D4ABEE|nr:FCD domain-containing protein [Timonella senegalensis]